MTKQYFRKFKGIKKCFLVEVCEGDGTSEFPMEAVRYILDNDMKLIGILETQSAKEKFND